jgi:hypothetical protein
MRANGQTENKVASLAFKSDEGPRLRGKRRDEAKRMRFGSEFPVGFRRQVARQVHGVVKDAKNLDHTTRRGAIDDEMPSATAPMCDVKRSQARHNLIARNTVEDVGAGFQRLDSLEQRLSIDVDLPLAEFVLGASQDEDEISLGLFAETNAPARLRQFDPEPETA